MKRTTSTAQSDALGTSVPSNPTLTASPPDTVSDSSIKRSDLGPGSGAGARCGPPGLADENADAGYWDDAVEWSRLVASADLPPYMKVAVSAAIGSMRYLRWLATSKGVRVEDLKPEDVIADFVVMRERVR